MASRHVRPGKAQDRITRTFTIITTTAIITMAIRTSTTTALPRLRGYAPYGVYRPAVVPYGAGYYGGYQPYQGIIVQQPRIRSQHRFLVAGTLRVPLASVDDATAKRARAVSNVSCC